jgi:hypothetical protein
MKASRPPWRTGRFLTIALACSVGFVVGCGDGLRVGIVKLPGTGGSTPGTGGTSPPAGSGGAGTQLEIDGVPSLPVEVMTGASEPLPGLSLRNAGVGTAHDVRVSLSPLPTSFYFSFDGCSGRSLDPGETCPLELTAMPEASGAQSVNVVAVSAEGAVSATVHAMAAGLVAVVDRPAVLSAALGCPSMDAVVRVTNLGHLTSLLVAPMFSAGLRDGQEDTCVSGASLSAGKACFLRVSAWPRAMGSGTESVTISGSPGGTASVALQTLGRADFVVAPLMISLTSPDGARVTDAVTVSVGTTPGVFRLVPPAVPGAFSPFSATTTCDPLVACSSCLVTVTFTPAGIGTVTGSLSIYGGAPPNVVALPTIVTLTGVR